MILFSIKSFTILRHNTMQHFILVYIMLFLLLEDMNSFPFSFHIHLTPTFSFFDRCFLRTFLRDKHTVSCSTSGLPIRHGIFSIHPIMSFLLVYAIQTSLSISHEKYRQVHSMYLHRGLMYPDRHSTWRDLLMPDLRQSPS